MEGPGLTKPDPPFPTCALYRGRIRAATAKCPRPGEGRRGCANCGATNGAGPIPAEHRNLQARAWTLTLRFSARAAYLRYERSHRRADFVGRVLLQEMPPLDGDFFLVRPCPAELTERTKRGISRARNPSHGRPESPFSSSWRRIRHRSSTRDRRGGKNRLATGPIAPSRSGLLKRLLSVD
jgi:hypothetical protein